MSKYIIEGGNKLSGKVSISGNKNAIFPCMAAALLTSEDIILKNVPNIADTQVLIEILTSIGVEVMVGQDFLRINSQNLNSHILPSDLMTRLRGSIVLVGGLLGRLGKCEFSHPGGDIIGRRGIDLHLAGFKKLGYQVLLDDQNYIVSKSNREKDVAIFLEIATVTGTENLILASVLGEKGTTIRNAASEPHIVDLCNMLNQMGAKIKGVGTQTLEIEAVSKLKGVEFSLGLDAIEFGTYAIAAAITGGEIEIENCHNLDIEPIIWPMVKMGVEIRKTNHGYTVSAKQIKAIPRLITNVWPGFPTDLMSVMIVLATQGKGVSLLHDWVYESRMFFADKLISMGANITIADPHRVLVSGPSRLYGRNLETPDIRAGMALVLAALVANGTSTINRAELIERGYESVVEKLSNLGAKINKIE